MNRPYNQIPSEKLWPIGGCRETNAASVEGSLEQLPVQGVAAVATGSGSASSAEVNQLRSLLDDANGKIHTLQSMMSEAGFPMRIKLGEDLHGNEDWVRVRPECQLRDVLRRLSELTSERQPSPNTAGHTPKEPSGSGGCV